MNIRFATSGELMNYVITNFPTHGGFLFNFRSVLESIANTQAIKLVQLTEELDGQLRAIQDTFPDGGVMPGISEALLDRNNTLGLAWILLEYVYDIERRKQDQAASLRRMFGGAS